jgi:hypothetical protein
MDESTNTNERKLTISNSQWALIALVVAFIGGSILYRFLKHEQLWQTSAMFIGVPAVLAIVLALTPKARTLTGGILKGITLALLIIAPLLGEGYVCILFASPLFYLVGIIVGVVADSIRVRRSAKLSCIAMLLIPMCMEGVIPQLTLNRMQTVEARRVVNASPGDVRDALSRSPRIESKLPPFLSIGFPRPLRASGEGLNIGSMRAIHFSGAEGDPEGDLRMQVVQSSDGFVRFATLSDESKLTQWIRWDSSEVRWHSINPTQTEVVWRVNFERELDPAWYFAPWERFAVDEAAKYLIEANATPSANAIPSGETR